MARGANSPPPNILPKVSFVKVQDDFSNHPTGVHDHISRSYGYNDFSDFKRPDYYIRYIEPLESELAEQVEYDMDEQDFEWLEAVNTERKKLQQDTASCEVFEIVMDRLEKEWFDLTKNIPKPDLALPSEDSTCAICDDSEGENTNAIVFCDGCNLAVHQDCYGVPYIPEGQWLCRKCTVSPENPVTCVLCPNEGGAFKQTVHGDWVHLLCAIWVPETRVANEVFMEPITGIEKISKQRWRLRCSVCDIREGACIQCTKPSCFQAFHATCARKEKLLMPMKSSQGSEAPSLACYCEKHLPREQQEGRVVALAAERAEADKTDDTSPSLKSSKTARAYAKTYKPGPPLVPHIIVEHVLQYIGKVNLRAKRDFALLVCKYWSLKREARRGAAFLKRLHLEPWTASSGGRQQTDEEKAIKLEFMRRLRVDLDQVRMIAELCRKRESHKLDIAEIIQHVFDRFLFAHEPPLRMAFEKIMGADRQEFFKNPVSKVDVPDYYDIIKRPMTWSIIGDKLDRHEYLDLQEFKNDINLIVTNAMTYNQPGTSFYKTAQKIQTVAEPILADLDKISSLRPTPEQLPSELQEQPPQQLQKQLPEHLREHSQEHLQEQNDEHPEKRPQGPELDCIEEGVPAPTGDLEPPIELLDMLVSEASITDDIELILDKEPLAALLTYELPRMKPPPPLPPPKPKRDRKADLARKRQERLDSAPGFRAPRTRRASATNAQFEGETETEVHVPTQPEAGPSSEAAASELSSREKSSRKPGRRGPLHVPGNQPAPVMESVDDRDSFSLFDKGWILPDDQRRGNRQRQQRSPLPPKKKSKKASTREKSLLATFNTAEAENETLQATPLTDFTTLPEGHLLHTEHDAAPESTGHVPAETVEETQVEPVEQAQGELVAKAPVQSVENAPAEPIEERPDEADAGVHAEAAVEVPAEPIAELPVEYPAELPAKPVVELPSEPVQGTLAEQVKAPATEGPAMSPLSDTQAFAKPATWPVDEPSLVDERSAVEVGEESTEEVAKEYMSRPVEELPRLPAENPAEVPMGESGIPAVEPAKAPMDVPTANDAVKQRKGKSKRRDEAPVRIIIIEELDTPAIRRQKYKKRKAERERLAAEAAAAAALDAQRTTQISQTSEETVGDVEMANADGGASELSSLSDLSDAEGRKSPVRVKESIVQTPTSGPRQQIDESNPLTPVIAKASTALGAISLPEGHYLEGGTLVWAKARTFPWWPAVVFEPDDITIPDYVSRTPPQLKEHEKGPVNLVQFYDSRKTWQWVTLEKLKLLGEDSSLDQEMLANKSRFQNWKTPKHKQMCRDAYRCVRLRGFGPIRLVLS
ncbi:uncharacterized protein LAESUDRAFT_698987 [Laetiporus sulphureus 93-53]|uniref:Bromodomain-containing protein n=1 Tax=Laetiporus sulphureus 93-53 TaxID=1314785 RepID=A0A165EJU5_9APHY|nr:uncharacterized protein LAESUDRAFT_698987 [Laetiporus sulphureus 93-53]KZT07202.1 hypothetical protein LAESUDRAFT_698987 [Laetiporus sulphureus 93-53]